MTNLDLGPLAQGPHAALLRALADKCSGDDRIQAMWVGGSLAGGYGDAYSDVDLRIAVRPGEVAGWTSPDWQNYLPILPVGSSFLRFGERALLHHLLLADGTILDFYVQDTTQLNYEPQIVILTCRDPQFKETLQSFARPADALTREIEGAVVRQFLIEYWITTHKQAKALARKYDLSSFAGLYMERMALLRAWYMQLVGQDIDSRATLHMLGVLHKGLAGKLTASQQELVGLPSRSPAETVRVIEGIRGEMAQVGRSLAERHAFAYPQELEAVVTQSWRAHKDSFMQR